MARLCDICSKGPHAGRSIVRHGLKKVKGGIGLHTTGISRRRFLPNIQRVRVVENGGVVRRNVCTACIRSKRITKA